jgi:hypothetical protein
MIDCEVGSLPHVEHISIRTRNFDMGKDFTALFVFLTVPPLCDKLTRHAFGILATLGSHRVIIRLFSLFFMTDRNIILGVLGLLIGVGALLFFVGGDSRSGASLSTNTPKEPSGENLPLAQCLAEKGAIFYGAFWCSHCRSQKTMFGDAAAALPYVECSTPDGRGQTPRCNEAGIESYPTWVFVDGSRLSGAQSLATLAERAGCVVGGVNTSDLPAAESATVTPESL